MQMAGVRTALLLLPPVPLVVLLVMAVRKLRASSGSSSSSLRSCLAVGELPVALYRRSGGGGGEKELQDAAVCVFCLSGIEEGSEVRELECRHLFHRGCLDRWLLAARPLATCPLCRCRLVPSPEYEEGESESDMMLFMACVHGCSSWLWPS
ncbi:hypothetical protein PVAP13_2NG616400 [Panicum virgatum]|uniref:RING-type domain-containing protein n=1 Tax=Panicum virgatum TaxID=38727 RepID=A0A8T0W1B8_PANVG|nr:hypothetical protein PVAP13_2NG616400 [Panicum virgatum]